MYAEVRRLEPYQPLGMDRYSTSLWHLQREVELSALAHDLTQLDKSCPQVSMNHDKGPSFLAYVYPGIASFFQ